MSTEKIVKQTRELLNQVFCVAFAAQSDALKELGANLYEVDQIFLNGCPVFDICGEFKNYAPLLSSTPEAFYRWLYSDPSIADDPATEKRCIGYEIAVRAAKVDAWLRFRIDVEADSIDEDEDHEEYDGWLAPEPMAPELMARCVQMVAREPGFGQLRNKKQRRDFAWEVLEPAEIGEITEDQLRDVAERSESVYLFEVLPAEAKRLKAEGLTLSQIAAKTGVSKAKVERALAADSPSHARNR